MRSQRMKKKRQGLCWLVAVIAICAPAVGDDPRTSMSDLLDMLAGGGSGAYEARDELKTMPSEEVIGTLVAWLPSSRSAIESALRGS